MAKPSSAAAHYRASENEILRIALVADGAMFPPLILVTNGSSGSLVLLEGHARLTAFMLAPDSLPPELEVLLGASPGMVSWGLW